MSTARKISIGIIGIAIAALGCLTLYYVAYARGLQAGLTVAEASSYSAMLADLAGSKFLASDKDKEVILAAASVSISQYLTALKISKFAAKPLANLLSWMKGNPTIFDLARSNPRSERELSTFLDMCREVVHKENLYKRYCESTIAEYQAKYSQ